MHWQLTFDDEFTQDASIRTDLWNGGAAGTPWCDSPAPTIGPRAGTFKGGCYIFGDCSDPCGQNYGGVSVSSNGLALQSIKGTGGQSAAINTSGKFSQKFGYFEASIKMPHNYNGEGAGLHPDFWGQTVGTLYWLPDCNNPDGHQELDIAERPSWDVTADQNNNAYSFNLFDTCTAKVNFEYPSPPIGDLSAQWHTYGLLWRDDGSGLFGSMQLYFDGVPQMQPYSLASGAAQWGSGIYLIHSMDAGTSPLNNDPTLIQYTSVWKLVPIRK